MEGERDASKVPTMKIDRSKESRYRLGAALSHSSQRVGHGKRESPVSENAPRRPITFGGRSRHVALKSARGSPQHQTPRQASAMKSFRRLHILLPSTFEISEYSLRQGRLGCPLLLPLAREFTSIDSRIVLPKSLSEIQVGPFFFGASDLAGSPS
jgi:hypothetical protein